MKKVLLFLALLFGALPAYAQVPTGSYIKGDNSGLMGLGIPGEASKYMTGNTWVVPNNVAVFANNASSTPVAVEKLDTANGLILQSATQGLVKVVPGVITPSTTFPTPVGATTPAAGDTLTNQIYIVATAAPTAAFLELPVATVQPGVAERQVWNRGANPVAIVAQGSDTINNTAAATAFSCTTGKLCTCRLFAVTGNGPWMCTGS